MGAKNSSAAKQEGEKQEEVRRATHFQNLTINSNSRETREIPLNVRVQPFERATSRFYCRVIPNSLEFLRMTEKNVHQPQHLRNYNSFVVLEPRPGFQVNGYAFLSTPILPTDPDFCFVIKLAEEKSSSFQNDGLQIGFTSCDPKSISWAELPYKNIEDLEKRKEYWNWISKFVREAHVGDELCIRVKSTGLVFASRNNSSANFLFRVDRSTRIWPFFALCGKVTEIRVLGKILLTQAQNQIKPLLEIRSALPTSTVGPPQISAPSPLEWRPGPSRTGVNDSSTAEPHIEVSLGRGFPRSNMSNLPLETEIPLQVCVRRLENVKSRLCTRVIPNSLAFLRMSTRNNEPLQHLRNYNSFVVIEPRPGFQVNGYAFLSTPICPTDSDFSFVIQLAQELSQFKNVGLRIGFTSCDPKSISWAELPYKNIDDLDNRKEYWIWDDQFANNSFVHDEFCITVKWTGQVFASRNLETERLLYFVDRSTRLWPFFALCGKLMEIRVLGKILLSQTQNQNQNHPMASEIRSALETIPVAPPQISVPSPLEWGLINSQNTPGLSRTEMNDSSTAKPLTEVSLSRGFQSRPNINSNPPETEIPLNVRVRLLENIQSRFYSCTFQNSLAFLRMSTRNDQQFLYHYNSFVVEEPRPGFQVNGYAFFSAPIFPTDSDFSFVIQLTQEKSSQFKNDGLRIGFTSCDPKSISWDELPYKNIEDLENRKEYWVWSHHFAKESQVHDEFCFTVKSTETRSQPLPSAPPIPTNPVSSLQISLPFPQQPPLLTTENPGPSRITSMDAEMCGGLPPNTITAAKQASKKEAGSRATQFVNSARQQQKKPKKSVTRERQSLTTNKNAQKTQLNVRVRQWSTTSRFYSQVIPDSLEFLSMSKRNDEPLPHVFTYNSFVVLEPRPRFQVNGYAFLSTPIPPTDSDFSFVIQLAEEKSSNFQNDGLRIGFTSCDPKSITWDELPYKKIESLDKRKEYWMWSDDFASKSHIDDEFRITVTPTGQAVVTKNGSLKKADLFHVDRSIEIWPFFALCGKLTEIRVLGKILLPQTQSQPLPSTSPIPTSLISSPPILLPSPPKSRLVDAQNPGPSRMTSTDLEILDGLPQVPRSSPSIIRQSQNCGHHDNLRGRGRGFRGNRGQRGARNANGGTRNENENNNGQEHPRENRSRVQHRGQRSDNYQNCRRGGGQSRGQKRSHSVSRPSEEESKPEKTGTDTKKQDDASNSLCIICCEGEKNCIFVPCGHNCMCFSCANEYFQRKKNEALGGQNQNPECPICRTQSTNVVRIYTA